MVARDEMVSPQLLNDRREDWLSDGILSGFVATIALTAALGAAYGIANWLGSEAGNQVERWLYALSHNRIIDRADNSLVLAIGLNLLAGLAFSLIYALIEQRIPFRRGWQKGMAFSLLLWILSLVAFFPIMGVGLFGSDLNAGPLAIFGNLVLHLIYGAALGSVYAVDLDAWLDGSREDHLAALDFQRSTTIGILSGGVVGGIVGFLARNQFENVWTSDLTILVGALVGASFGGWIGSVMTEEHQDRSLRP
jgi:hypothetical protein